jgi:hypothetical protein
MLQIGAYLKLGNDHMKELKKNSDFEVKKICHCQRDKCFAQKSVEEDERDEHLIL